MISVKADSKTGRLGLIASGSALDLLVETSAVIGTVYARLMEGSPENAQVYREALVKCLADPESAVWDVQQAMEGTWGTSVVIPVREDENDA